MLYKPKYCCNCGERIERVEWKITSSRKFCELCETEYKFEEMLPKFAVLILTVFGVWGFGNLFFSSGETLIVKDSSSFENTQTNTKRSFKTNNLSSESDDADFSSKSKKNTSTLKKEQTTQKDSASQQNLLPKNPSQIDNSTKDTQKQIDEPVYFCGAETKKGTPCSRRVKGGGRCWQHKHREPMLPKKDLKVEK